MWECSTFPFLLDMQFPQVYEWPDFDLYSALFCFCCLAMHAWSMPINHVVSPCDLLVMDDLLKYWGFWHLCSFWVSGLECILSKRYYGFINRVLYRNVKLGSSKEIPERSCTVRKKMVFDLEKKRFSGTETGSRICKVIYISSFLYLEVEISVLYLKGLRTQI